MFLSGMKEANEGAVTLQDTPVEAFKAILGYMYSGKLNIAAVSEEVVIDILGLAHLYDMPTLESGLVSWLKNTFTVSHVLRRLETAHVFNLPSLQEACYTFIDQNFLKVSIDESFLTLDEVRSD
jgi:BTB/POZ domain-containing protein 9